LDRFLHLLLGHLPVYRRFQPSTYVLLQQEHRVVHPLTFRSEIDAARELSPHRHRLVISIIGRITWYLL
jgi:hypothetical protein